LLLVLFALAAAWALAALLTWRNLRTQERMLSRLRRHYRYAPFALDETRAGRTPSGDNAIRR